MSLIIAGIDPSINGTAVTKLYLDENLDIVKYRFIAFTSVKKNSGFFENGTVIHYNAKNFKNNFDKNIFMYSAIMEFVSDADFLACEDYSFASVGSVFQIAEFCGTLKYQIYNKGIPIRLTEPTVLKKFSTGSGTADKVRIEDTYRKGDDVLGVKDFQPYSHPLEDILDSFYIAKFLHLELLLRHGKIEMKSLPLEHIELFNRVTKAHPENLLSRDFISKE